MAHPNEGLIRKGFDAFGKGDLATVQTVFADDVIWHVPGRSTFAGDYKGWEEVSGFLAKTLEWTGGSLKLQVHDALANDTHGVALFTETGTHDGKTLNDNAVMVVHIQGGKITESWFHPGDAYAVDEFWS